MKLAAVLKKSLALVLVLCICMSFMNLNVFADEPLTDPGDIEIASNPPVDDPDTGDDPTGSDEINLPGNTDPIYTDQPDTSIVDVCNCTTKCTEGSINEECPVCGAAGADLAKCVGEEQQAAPAETADIKGLLTAAKVLSKDGNEIVSLIAGQSYSIDLTFTGSAAVFLAAQALTYQLPELFDAGSATATVSVIVPAAATGSASPMALGGASTADISPEGTIKITLGSTDVGKLTASGEEKASIDVKVTGATVPANTPVGNTTVLFSETVPSDLTVGPEDATHPTVHCVEDLIAALDRVEDGAIVVLSKDSTDFTVTQKIKIKKSVTLDLNGITLTAAQYFSSAMIEINYQEENETIDTPLTVTICNGELVGTTNDSRGILVQEISDKLSIKNVKFRGFSNNSKNGLAIRYTPEKIDGEPSLTIQDCTFSDNTTSKSGIVYTDGGNVVIENCTFDGNKVGNDGTLYVKNGTLVVDNCIFTNNSAGRYAGAIYTTAEETKLTGGKFENNSAGDSGGAIFFAPACQSVNINGVEFLSNSCAGNGSSSTGLGGAIYSASLELTLTNTKFDSNTAGEKGGGVAAQQSSKHNGNVPKVTVTNCIFNKNYALWGGGLFTQNSDVDINGGSTFSLNDATTDNPSAGGEDENTDDSDIARGGGIHIRANSATINVKLDDFTLKNNHSQWYGGGIYFAINSKASTLTIGKGQIIGNAARYGAGIDYSRKDQIPLQLTNVLITNNTAKSFRGGGGIWVCPTSTTEVHSTLGGAIFGNDAWYDTYNERDGNGDDVRYNGYDNPDGSQGGVSDSTTARLIARSLGGYELKWYKDDAGSRYNSANPIPVEIRVFEGTKMSFAAHSELSEEGQQYAYENALLIIRDNIASGRGGGISSNSPVIIGERNADKSLTVTKVWQDSNRNPLTEGLPDSIEVTLYRVAGGTRVELETVHLTAENDWTHTFTDLPAYGLDRVPYEYTVGEGTCDGFTTNISPTTETGKEMSVTITNTKITGSLSISKTVVGGGDAVEDKEFTFNVTGPKGYTNSVTLKAGETKELTNLDPGEYTVTENVSGAQINGYTLEVTGGSTKTVMIPRGHAETVSFTNTYTQKLGSLTITKAVEFDGIDENDTLPDAATREYTFNITGPNGYSHTVTITGGGHQTIEGLVPGEYTITEDISGIAYDHWTLSVDGGDAVNVEADKDTPVTITNTYTHETISVTVLKVWEEEDGSAVQDPDGSITVYLYNGNRRIETATLNARNNWTVTWENLPEDGDYDVREGYVSGWSSNVTLTRSGDPTVFTITNTRIPVVETTPPPETTPEPTPEVTPQPTPEPTPEPTATPEPSVSPTPTPSTPPTPTPSAPQQQTQPPEENDNPNEPQNPNEPTPVEDNPNQDIPNRDVPQGDRPDIPEDHPNNPNVPNVPEDEPGTDLPDADVPTSDFPPETGETIMTIVWMGLLVGSGVGILLTVLPRKRKTK